MISSISPLDASSGATATGSAGASASALSGPAPTQQMFLQLLVAQIKNQDPLNPTDSTQFVSQLAQFSELENVIAIRGDLDTVASSSAGATAATGSTQS